MADKKNNSDKSKQQRLKEEIPEARKQQGEDVDTHDYDHKKSDLRIKDRESGNEASRQSEYDSKAE